MPTPEKSQPAPRKWIPLLVAAGIAVAVLVAAGSGFKRTERQPGRHVGSCETIECVQTLKVERDRQRMADAIRDSE